MRLQLLRSEILQDVGNAQQVDFLSYAAITVELIFVLVFIGVGIFIFLQCRNDARVAYFSAVIIALGLDQSLIAEVIDDARLTTFTAFSVVAIWYLFPDGHFRPRWTAIPVALWGMGCIYWYLHPEAWMNPIYTQTSASGVPVPLFLMVTAFCGLGLWSQYYRYRRADEIVRQQTKWIGIGFCFIFTGAVLQYSPLFDVPATSPMGVLIRMPLAVALSIVWPITIAFAVLQYRLWDADIFISRTAVYTILIVILGGIYILILTLMTAILQGALSDGAYLPSSLTATAAVTVAFQPLRDRVRRAVNRLLFGDRDDPYKVMQLVSRDLEQVAAIHSLLPGLLERIARSLKLPWLSVTIYQEDESVVVAQFSASALAVGDEPGGDPTAAESMSLIYQNQEVGQLVLGQRTPGEALTLRDKELLADIMPMLAVTVFNLNLTATLQRTLERMVTAQEEERRRIRNDFHDDLGPKLATLRLRIDNTANAIRRDPSRADPLLTDLSAMVQDVTGDVRQLVRGLRPPELDDLGLVEAIRISANQYRGIEIRVEMAQPLPTLSAAVESTAYRIVHEAIINAVRHAAARNCQVRLAYQPNRLTVTIEDNGCGFDPTTRTGIGLRSMHERAEILGGSLKIEGAPGQGTRVTATLPVRPASEKKDADSPEESTSETHSRPDR